MKIKELIEQFSRGEGHENLEKYLEDFLPNTLLKSETLQKAFEISGEEMSELYQKAYHFYQEDRFDQSVILFRWLVILNPFIVKFWMGLGSSQQLLNQHDKALHSYAIWSLLENSNPTPHFKAYECYQALDQQGESKKALCQALERAHQPNYNQLKQEVERCLQHLS